MKKRIDRERKPKGWKYIAPLAVEDVEVPVGRCTMQRHKARYANEESARRALRQAQKSREAKGHDHVEKRAYACPACDGWHLTSSETYQKKKAKK